MEGRIISKEPALDESEIKALIENFDTIGILLKEAHARLLSIFSNPVLAPGSKKLCNEGLVLIKKAT